MPANTRFIRTASILLLAIVALDLVNGRLWLSDFRVYWEASGHFLRGEAPYGEAFGLDSGLYKYSPFTLLLFVPWALLPYGFASVLFALLIAAGMVFGIVRAERMVRERSLRASIKQGVLWIALPAVVVHLHRELHLGNVNMILLGILLLAGEGLLAERHWRAGALIGLAVLVKPHFVVLVPLLLLHGRWREVLVIACAIAAGTLLPALFVGWNANMGLHADWLHAMAAHNASPFYTGEGPKMATDTIYSVLWRLSSGALPATRLSAAIVLALVTAAVLAFDRWNARRHSGDPMGRDRDLLFTFLLLIALVPSITPTDTEHFLLAAPLVIFLLHHLFDASRPAWLLPASIIVLLGYGGNWQDLWGPWSGVLADHGVLGAANLLLIVLCGRLYACDARAATTP